MSDAPQRARSVLVEVAGLAGSGKTTTINRLREAPALRDSAYRLPMLRSLPQAARNLLIDTVPLVLEPQPRSVLFDLRLLTQYDAMVADLRRPRAPGRARILDQGPIYFQAVSTYLILAAGRRRALLPRRTRGFDAFAPALDAVVWLDAENDVLLSRIEERAKNHLVKGSDGAAGRIFLDEYRAVYAELLDRLAARGVPIVRIDTGTATPVEVAERAAAELRRLSLLV